MRLLKAIITANLLIGLACLMTFFIELAVVSPHPFIYILSFMSIGLTMIFYWTDSKR